MPIETSFVDRTRLLLGPRHGALVSAVATRSPTSPASFRTRLGLLRRSVTMRSTAVDIELPEEFGDLSIAKVGRRGTRTFHFERGVAGRFTTESFDTFGEQHSLELGGPLGIAPRLVAADDDGRWILEELLPGRDLRRDDPATWRTAIDDIVDTVLSPLWTAEPVRSIEREDYLDQLASFDAAQFVQHDRAAHDRYRDALDSLTTSAMRRTDPVPIVWSHGDLFRKNLLQSEDGTWTAIDWEYAAPRSPALDGFGIVLDLLDRREDHDESVTRVLHAVRSRRAPEDALAEFFADPAASLAIGALELLERDRPINGVIPDHGVALAERLDRAVRALT